MNAIRKVEGVNAFKMDHDLGIEIECKKTESGLSQMIPDISKNVLGYSRYLFCDGEPNLNISQKREF